MRSGLIILQSRALGIAKIDIAIEAVERPTIFRSEILEVLPEDYSIFIARFKVGLLISHFGARAPIVFGVDDSKGVLGPFEFFNQLLRFPSFKIYCGVTLKFF